MGEGAIAEYRWEMWTQSGNNGGDDDDDNDDNDDNHHDADHDNGPGNPRGLVTSTGTKARSCCVDFPGFVGNQSSVLRAEILSRL